MKLDVAKAVARALVDHLREGFVRVEIAGSIRRNKPEVKDIEIVAVPDLSPLARPVAVFGQPIPKWHKTILDRMLAEMAGGEQIELKMNGPRFKKLYLRYAGIWVDLFLVVPPSEWGVQYVIRTGPKEFGEWIVTSRRRGGGLPDGHFVKHGVVWVEGLIDKQDVPDDQEKARLLLTTDNHLAMPEESDFLDFCGLGWLEPGERRSRWGR